MKRYFFQSLVPGKKVKYKKLELSEVIHLSYFLRGRWLEVCKERCLSFSVLTVFRADTIRRGQLPWFCSFAQVILGFHVTLVSQTNPKGVDFSGYVKMSFVPVVDTFMKNQELALAQLT